jgi:hypothetical protein
MGRRKPRARLLALAVVMSVPVVGISTLASAKPAHHRSITNDVDDGTWTPSEAPVPANALSDDQRVYITGTACPGPGSCIAVGYYDTADATLGLIDTISDGTSTLIEAPLPPDSHTGDLSGITFSSVDFCVAVGNYGDDRGLIETMENGTWTATVTPVPSDVPRGVYGVTVDAVTCPADGSCVMVGLAAFQGEGPDYEQGIPFIDTLSDGTWTSIDAPLPANALVDFYEDGPTSVSCGAVGSCAAVGMYHYADYDTTGLIDTLSDGTWTAQAAPAPPSTVENQWMNVNAVSCPGAGSCVAIAEYSVPVGEIDTTEAGVILTLSGGSWSEIQPPIPAGVTPGFAQLSSVACPAAGSCEIEGAVVDGHDDGGGSSLFEDLSGGTWTPSSPSLAGGPLDCPAVESCVSVGANVVSTLSDGVWTSTTVPLPANAQQDTSGSTYANLESVSCATITSCAAIGDYRIVAPPGAPDDEESLIETLGLGGVPAPVISSADQATFAAGQSNSFTITASGPQAPVLSEKGKLPKGLHFEEGQGTATITGKPSKKTGIYLLTITAKSTSANERISQPFGLTVAS